MVNQKWEGTDVMGDQVWNELDVVVWVCVWLGNIPILKRQWSEIVGN